MLAFGQVPSEPALIGRILPLPILTAFLIVGLAGSLGIVTLEFGASLAGDVPAPTP